MIYISKGVTNAQMTKIETDDPFQFIANYKPQLFSNEQMTDKVKLHQAAYFIAGELKDGYRKDENLIQKKMITIDYDDIGQSLEEENRFLATIHNKLAGLRYMIYPTFNHNIKGNRYRLVIDTDECYTRDLNANLILNVARYIGVKYDMKSETYSQLMGMPLVTPVTLQDMIEVRHGEPLRVDDFSHEPTAEAKQWRESLTPKEEQGKPLLTVNYKGKSPYRKGKGVAGALNKAMGGIREGNRNNELTSLYGTLIKPLGVENAIELTYWINESYVNPPLESDELEKIFKSITKKETGKEVVV